MFLGVFILINIFYIVLSTFNYQDATCSTTNAYANYSLDFNTVIYFRSPDFPKSMKRNDMENQIFCNARFYGTGNDSQLMLLLYNGAFGPLYISDGIDPTNDKTIVEFDNTFANYTSTGNEILFKFNDGIFPKWTAFEAIVFSFDKTSYKKYCPFSYQTLELKKDKAYPIMAYFQNKKVSGCSWTFQIDPTLMLKLVIKKFSNDDDDEDIGDVLILKTEGKTIESFEDKIESKNPKVFYYSSESGIFDLSFDMYQDNCVLFAVVSAVENLTIPIVNECQNNKNGNLTEIVLVDFDHGYTAYDSCYYSFRIPDQSEVVLNVEEFFVEMNVDNLLISTETGKFYELQKSDTYHLSSDVKNPMIQFEADGNIQQAGFKITNTVLDCQCSSSKVVISCFESYRVTALPNTDAYCMLQQCNYTISLNENCTAEYLKFKYSFNLFGSDNVVLLENNKKIEEYTNATTSGSRLFPKSSKIFFSFKSEKTESILKTDKSWSIDMIPEREPKFITIYLNNSLPYFIPLLNEMKENEAFVICSAQNDILELFLSENQKELSYFALFDSNKIENFVGDLSLLLPRYLSSSSGCFTLWKGEKDISLNVIALFTMQKARGNNCEDPQNVLIVKEKKENIFFNKAKSTDPCIIILLASTPVIRLNEISTSSNDSYEVTSPINGNQYFTINSMDTSLWKDTTIYSSIIKISIPPLHSLNISTTALKVLHDNPIIINFSLSKQKGILASSSYCGSSPSENDFYKFVQLYDLKSDIPFDYSFTVRHVYGNATIFLDSKVHNLTLTNQSTVQTSTSRSTDFSIFYQQQNSSTDSFLIEYTVSPPTPNITLNAKKPYHTYWLDDLKPGDYLTACADGVKVEIFFTYYRQYLWNYTLYDGIGFANRIGTFQEIIRDADDDDYPIHIASTLSNCFTLKNTKGLNSYITLLFRMKNKQNEFCNGKNIFQAVTPDYFEQNISLSVAENHECEIIILSKYPEDYYGNGNVCDYSNCAPFVFLYTIFGSSEVFKIEDATNGNLFAAINNTEISQWEDILIYTNALKITVTNEVLIDFAFKGQKNEVANINGFLTTENPIQKGLFASPSYSGIQDPFVVSDNPLYNITSNKTLALNLEIIKMNKNTPVSLMVDGKEYLISKNEMLFGNSFQLFFQNDSSMPTDFLIEYSLLNINKNTQKNLDTKFDKHVLWLDDLGIDDMITVCSHETDNILQLFVPNLPAGDSFSLGNFVLFDGNTIVGSLQSDVLTRLSSNSPRQITSKSGCFRIQKTDDKKYPLPVLFRLKNANGRGCATPNILETSSIVTNITATAFPNGECEIILLVSSPQRIPPVIYISSIQATSRDIITVKSTINGNVLAEFNGISADNWKDLYFFTPALSFIIPKDSSISFLMSNVNSNKTVIKDLIDFQKGVFGSYAFNGFDKLNAKISFVNNNDCGINFNVNYLSSADDNVIIKMGNISHTFTQNDDFTTYEPSAEISSSSNFSISYDIVNCSSSFILTTTNSEIYTTPHKNGSVIFYFDRLIFLATIFYILTVVY